MLKVQKLELNNLNHIEFNPTIMTLYPQSSCLKIRGLRRADRAAAAAGFSETPLPPKFGIGAPNAAADNLWSPPA